MLKSKIKIISVVITVGLMVSSNVHGQRWKMLRYEVGGGIGFMQVFSDIGGSADEQSFMGIKDIKLKETKPGFSGFIRYKIQPKYSVKVAVNYGFGGGSDIGSVNEARGFEFKTSILEIESQFEYFIITEEKSFRTAAMYNKRGMINNYNSFGIYVFGGLGMASVSPDITPVISDFYSFNNEKHSSVIFPIGLGTKFIVNERFNLNFELGYRFTTDDYIEGFTSANSKHNDLYYFGLLTLGYKIKTSKRGIPAFIDSRYRRYGY